MSLTATIIADALASYTKAADQGTAAFPPIITSHYSITNGTAANQANGLWCDERTLSASASDSLDLSGGLTDIYGATLTFTKIKVLLVKASADNGDDLTVGSTSDSPDTGFSTWLGAEGHSVRVAPGGLLLVVAPDADGFAVTAGTGDILTVANTDDAAVTYEIMLIGVTA